MAAKVLVVDDDDSIRLVLTEILRHAGYRTQTAGTYEEGLVALATDPPDLLITDVRLGEHSGLQLLAGAPRPIPAIVMTGFADPTLRKDAHHLGAYYLMKPVSPPDLLMLVEKKLAGAGEDRSGPAGGIPSR